MLQWPPVTLWGSVLKKYNIIANNRFYTVVDALTGKTLTVCERVEDAAMICSALNSVGIFRRALVGFATVAGVIFALTTGAIMLALSKGYN